MMAFALIASYLIVGSIAYFTGRTHGIHEGMRASHAEPVRDTWPSPQTPELDE